MPRDGLFGFADGLDNIASHLAPLATRLLDRSARESVHDRDLVNASPTVAELRPRLRELAGGVGYPQAVLRLGYGPAGRATPRRALGDVLR